MAEIHGEGRAELFAQTPQNVIDGLEHGTTNALSDFMYRENKAGLRTCPALVVPGCSMSWLPVVTAATAAMRITRGSGEMLFRIGDVMYCDRRYLYSTGVSDICSKIECACVDEVQLLSFLIDDFRLKKIFD